MNIAEYYQNQQDWGKAGEFYALCAQYHKALKLFLQCGESEMDKVSHRSFVGTALHLISSPCCFLISPRHQAIDVVGKARSDMLTHTLIDFLMGETDGVPKDPNFISK